MNEQQIKKRQEEIHEKCKALRKDLVQTNAPFKKAENKLTAENDRYNSIVDECKVKMARAKERYLDVRKKYDEINNQRTDINTKLNNLYAENMKLQRYLSRITFYTYAEDVDNIVKELMPEPEYRCERKREPEEHIIRTTPHTKNVTLEDGTKATRDACVIQDFLDIIWRINRQVTYHGSSFSWKLVREIRYFEGEIYVSIKLPQEDFNATVRRQAVESSTCTNLDIDWDWIESVEIMPAGIVLIDTKVDDTLRLQLNRKWLNRTPAELDYREYLEQEAERKRKACKG